MLYIPRLTVLSFCQSIQELLHLLATVTVCNMQHISGIGRLSLSHARFRIFIKCGARENFYPAGDFSVGARALRAVQHVFNGKDRILAESSASMPKTT